MKKRITLLLAASFTALIMAAPAFALPQQAQNACQGIDKSRAPDTPARSHSPVWPICK